MTGESAPATGGVGRWLNSPADGAPVTLRQGLFIIAGVLFGDLLLYEYSGGVGTALFFLIVMLGLVALRPERVRTREVYLLTAYLALLAFRQAWDYSFGGTVLAWLLLGTLAVFCATDLRRLAEGTVAGAFSYLMCWSMAMLYAGAALVGLLSLWQGLRDRKWRACALILVPLLAALFTAVLFALVFIAANPVLGHYWEMFYARFAEIIDAVLELIPGLGHICFWGVMLCVMAGLVTPLLPRRLTGFINARREEQTPASGRNILLLATALAMLAAANLAFFAYNLLDARYLWLHGALPAGITFSQYAHEGTGWLTFALLLATVFIGLTTSPWLVPDCRDRGPRLLSFLWVVQGGVMAVGVLRRIQLYVAYNGLTSLRLLGIAGTLLILSGLAVMVVKLWRRRNIIWLLRRYVAAFIIALVICALFPDDYACARFNVWQAMHDNDRPLVWLAEHQYSLGSEAYPALLPLLNHPKPVVRDGVRAFLSARLALFMTTAGPAEPNLGGVTGRHPLEQQLSDEYALARLRAAGLTPGERFDWRFANDPDWQAFDAYVRQWRNGPDWRD